MGDLTALEAAQKPQNGGWEAEPRAFRLGGWDRRGDAPSWGDSKGDQTGSGASEPAPSLRSQVLLSSFNQLSSPALHVFGRLGRRPRKRPQPEAFLLYEARFRVAGHQKRTTGSQFIARAGHLHLSRHARGNRSMRTLHRHLAAQTGFQAVEQKGLDR